ncbi:MAG: Rrf2 family transcriptional regulator [Desulfobacterales bacterium]|nr:Rrf2 family transcriptional regulator [Desulfobacterales bacterium]MCP4162441.1 Rrf2 family transcriptional regulator [Deltaproteobacteria bacterium]
MLITKKEQYALRAMHELGQNRGKRLLKTSEIAESQAIPVRFLEVILGQLKRAGIVESKRGYKGGYSLVSSPEEVTVGDVFRGLQKTHDTVSCAICDSGTYCPYMEGCVFMPMWKKVQGAISEIYDSTTINDFLN